MRFHGNMSICHIPRMENGREGGRGLLIKTSTAVNSHNGYKFNAHELVSKLISKSRQPLRRLQGDGMHQCEIRNLDMSDVSTCDVFQDVNLMNWSLQRTVDNKRKIIFKFPPNAVIKIGKTIKVSVLLFLFKVLSAACFPSCESIVLLLSSPVHVLLFFLEALSTSCSSSLKHCRRPALLLSSPVNVVLFFFKDMSTSWSTSFKPYQRPALLL